MTNSYSDSDSDSRAGAGFHRGKSKQDYVTPPDFIDAVERRLGKLAFDLAASPENAQADDFFTVAEDSLAQDWGKLQWDHSFGPWLWLNPPYADITPWAKKCWQHSHQVNVLLLVPASVGSNWWRDYVHQKAAVLFLNGRLKFVGSKDYYPKDCALVCFGPSIVSGYDIWNWRAKCQ